MGASRQPASVMLECARPIVLLSPDRTMARRSPASPLRTEIVDEIRKRGPSSLAKLAAALVRPKTALYFHVQRLLLSSSRLRKEPGDEDHPASIGNRCSSALPCWHVGP